MGRLLGSGAFARVYDGLTPRGGRVAVKIQMSDHGQALARFKREVKVSKALPPNPFIVGYRGEGNTRDGRPFLALEYVDGYTLADLFASDVKPTLRGACRLMMQLCDAFAALHKLGLTHGDIKPRNIMITRDGRAVKLLDFGLVRDSQGLLQLFEEHDILSGKDFADDLDAGMLMGTPEYMAPEQMADADVDDRSQRRTDTPADVFGLGVIFFEMLTGKRPWPMESAPGGGGHVQQALKYMDWRLGLKDIALPRPAEIEPALWSIIAKALRQNPRNRQGDARALRVDIQHYLDTGGGVSEGDMQVTTTAIEVEALQSLLIEASRRMKVPDFAAMEKPPSEMFQPVESRSSQRPQWPIIVGATVVAWLLVAAALYAAGVIRF